MKRIIAALTLGLTFSAIAADEVFVPTVGTYCLKMEKVVHRVYENTNLGPQGDHFYYVGVGSEGSYMIKPMNSDVFEQVQKIKSGDQFCVQGVYSIEMSRMMAIEVFKVL